MKYNRSRQVFNNKNKETQMSQNHVKGVFTTPLPNDLTIHWVVMDGSEGERQNVSGN
jgi:hypothetical protein